MGIVKDILLNGWRTNTGVVGLIVAAILGYFGIVDTKIVELVAGAAVALIGYGLGKKMDKAAVK